MSDDFSVQDILALCVDSSDVSTSRSAVDEFVDAIEYRQDCVDERRAEQRKPAVLDVIVVPLDAQFKPIGEPFLGLTRDISRGGIAMLHVEAVSAPYLLLKLQTRRHRSLQAVVEVVRSRRYYQFTEISGRFAVTRGKKKSTSRSPKRKSRTLAR